MTKFAKPLVIVGFVLSMFFAAFAFSVFTQARHMAKNETNKTDGVLDRLKAEEASYDQGLRSSHVAFMNSQKEVEAIEVRQTGWRNFYRNELQILNTGKGLDGNEVQPPVRELNAFQPTVENVSPKVFGMAMQIFDRRREDQAPQLRDAQHVEYYLTQIKDRYAAIASLETDIKKKQDEALEITKLLIDEADMRKGLLSQRTDQESIIQKLIVEIERVKPLANAVRGYESLLQKRLTSLQSRAKELGLQEAAPAGN